MMPVPSHLVGCVAPKDSLVDESPLDADIRCPCGSIRFDLLFPGQTHKFQGETCPCTATIDGAFFFLVKAHCIGCQREHLLIDVDLHGWNGFVCHDVKQAVLPRPPLIPWKCLDCGATAHEASILIQTEGKADFMSESGGKFDAAKWPEAFGCLSMAIKCSGCGKQTPEWICCETM
jgi:hypothetical protein